MGPASTVPGPVGTHGSRRSGGSYRSIGRSLYDSWPNRTDGRDGPRRTDWPRWPDRRDWPRWSDRRDRPRWPDRREWWTGGIRLHL